VKPKADQPSSQFTVFEDCLDVWFKHASGISFGNQAFGDYINVTHDIERYDDTFSVSQYHLQMIDFPAKATSDDKRVPLF
jgi:hypothetical protein